MKLHFYVPALLLLLIPFCNCVLISDVVGFSKRAFSGLEGSEISVCVELVVLNSGGHHQLTIGFQTGNFGEIHCTIYLSMGLALVERLSSFQRSEFNGNGTRMSPLWRACPFCGLSLSEVLLFTYVIV